MAAVSRSIMLTATVVFVGAGIYQYSNSQGAATPAAAIAPQGGKKAQKPSDYTDQDYLAHFDRPSTKKPLRNIFMPLVRNDMGPEADSTAVKDILHVPGSLAGGDPNWIFTGYAVINGEKSGLLENRSNHQSAFVKEGETWKTSRVSGIGSGSIILDDLAGGHVAVMRYDESLASKSQAKTPPDDALKPAVQQMQGPIGPGGPGGPGGPRMRGMPMNMGGGPTQMIVNGAVMNLNPGG